MSFSPLSNLYQMITDTQESVSTVQTVESPASYITVTRTATLALTTAGTTLVWQSAIRSQSITFSNEYVIIPSAGYYHLSANIALSTNTNCVIRIVIDSVTQLAFNTVPFNSGSGFVSGCSAMLYLPENVNIVIVLIPAANTTLNRNAEGTTAPSPILNIVQLSGVV